MKVMSEGLQKVARAVPVLLGLAFFFVPARRTPLQIAALGAALLIATQVGSTHWFYFFILWFTPYVLVNLFASRREIVPVAADGGGAVGGGLGAGALGPASGRSSSAAGPAAAS